VLAEKDIEDLKGKMQGALTRFLMAKEVGVLMTTKPGQARAKEAYELERRYPDKKFYFLLANTIDFGELENFPFIECFVNTACPRIGYDDTNKIRKPVVNLDDLELLEKE
jgi:2-(3-amino-3-carboxypropyl)histidine synthase